MFQVMWHRVPPNSTTMATALRVTGEACPGSIRPMRELVAGVAREHGLSERRADELKLCVHEAMVNVLDHAYDGQTGPVELCVDDRGDSLAVVVSDHGVGTPGE